MSRFTNTNNIASIKKSISYDEAFLSITDIFSPSLPEFNTNDCMRTLCPYNIVLCYIDVSGSTFNTHGRYGTRFSRHAINININDNRPKTKIICIAEMECISHLFAIMANKYIFDPNMIIKVYTFSDGIYNGAILDNVTPNSLYEFANSFPKELMFNSSSTATNLVFDNIVQHLNPEQNVLCVLATDGQPNDKQLTLKSVTDLTSRIKSQSLTMMIIGSGSISNETVLPFSRSNLNGIIRDIPRRLNNIENNNMETETNSENNPGNNTRIVNSAYSECDIDYIRSLLDFFSSKENLFNLYVGAYGDYDDAKKAFIDFFDKTPIVWKAYLLSGKDNNPIICNSSLSEQVEISYIKKIITTVNIPPYGNYLIFPIDYQFGHNIYQIAIESINNNIPDEIMEEINTAKEGINKEYLLNNLEYPTVVWHNANTYDGYIYDSLFYVLCYEKIKKTSNDNPIIHIHNQQNGQQDEQQGEQQNEQQGEQQNEQQDEQQNEQQDEQQGEQQDEQQDEQQGEQAEQDKQHDEQYEHNDEEQDEEQDEQQDEHLNEHQNENIDETTQYINSYVHNIVEQTIINIENNNINQNDSATNVLNEYELNPMIYVTSMTSSNQLRIRKLRK